MTSYSLEAVTPVGVHAEHAADPVASQDAAARTPSHPQRLIRLQELPHIVDRAPLELLITRTRLGNWHMKINGARVNVPRVADHVNVLDPWIAEHLITAWAV